MTAYEQTLRAAPAAKTIWKKFRLAVPGRRIKEGTLERRFGKTRVSRSEVQELFEDDLCASRSNLMDRAVWRGHDEQKVKF